MKQDVLQQYIYIETLLAVKAIEQSREQFVKIEI